MLNWKDEESRKTGEVESSELKLTDFKLVIHRHIHYSPDDWLLSVHYLMDKKVLKSKDIKDAKIEALNIIKTVLGRNLAELQPS